MALHLLPPLTASSHRRVLFLTRPSSIFCSCRSSGQRISLRASSAPSRPRLCPRPWQGSPTLATRPPSSSTKPCHHSARPPSAPPQIPLKQPPTAPWPPPWLLPLSTFVHPRLCADDCCGESVPQCDGSPPQCSLLLGGTSTFAFGLCQHKAARSIPLPSLLSAAAMLTPSSARIVSSFRRATTCTRTGPGGGRLPRPTRPTGGTTSGTSRELGTCA